MTIYSDHDSNPGSDQSALERMPSRFPIFPLSGAILLPGGNLPLNIFEPRYLQMIKDVMRGDKIIGMIQPSTSCSEGVPALYPVGCVGKITNFETTEDGRSLITLTGLCRFEIVEELTAPPPIAKWWRPTTAGRATSNHPPLLTACAPIWWKPFAAISRCMTSASTGVRSTARHSPA